jgi:hypothetical protein
MRLKSAALLLIFLSPLTTIFNIMPVLTATNAQGNVNCPGCFYATQYPEGVDIVVDMIDGAYVARAFGSTEVWPHGIDWGEYNVDADFDKDGWVWAYDLYIFARNFGLVGD